MKYRIILAVFCLGILIGVTLFSQPTTTGKATECYVDNELCTCDEKECVCGEKTVNADYCSKTFDNSL
jgi:hypothetical protein